MKAFLVVAYDGFDDAKEKRRAARPAHLERIVPFVETGTIIMGGGLLNRDGDAVGSAFFATFESREAAQDWCDADPYVKGGVWVRIEITEVNIVVRDRQIVP